MQVPVPSTVLWSFFFSFFPSSFFLSFCCGILFGSWKHNATSPMIADSIPDDVTGTFHSLHPSDRTTAMGPAQPLTEMRTSNISLAGVWGWKPYHLHLPTVWNSASWNPQGMSTHVQGLLYLFLPFGRLLFVHSLKQPLLANTWPSIIEWSYATS